MPLPQYAVMHRDARLSDAEIDIVYQWARLERRRVKAAARDGVAKPVLVFQQGRNVVELNTRFWKIGTLPNQSF